MKPNDTKAVIRVQNKTIPESTKAKCLGVTIDKNIIMGDHIRSICTKTGNKLNVFVRITKYLDETKRKLLMNSFKISQFNYCPIVWMYCHRKSNNLINIIHEKVLCIVYNDYTLNFNYWKRMILFPFTREILKL